MGAALHPPPPNIMRLVLCYAITICKTKKKVQMPQCAKICARKYYHIPLLLLQVLQYPCKLINIVLLPKTIKHKTGIDKQESHV